MKTILQTLAVLSPIIAIIWRIIYRGYHYAGWEIFRAVKGLYKIETLKFSGMIKNSWHGTRHCQYCGGNGLLNEIIPGSLLWIYPWEYTPILWKLILFILSFWLLGLSFLKGKQWLLLALILGSSPLLLSISIIGGGYTSIFLPHALTILIIFHPIFKEKWCAALLLGAITIELSWHASGIARIIFIPFILATFLQSNATFKHRIVNFVLGGTSFILVKLFPVGAVVNELQKTDNLIPITSENILKILKIIFIDPKLDITILPVLGIICLIFLKRNKLLLAGMLFAQWILVLLLGIHDLSYLRPRRFILVDFYSIIILLTMAKQWLPEINKTKVYIAAQIFIIILIGGNIWQFANLVNYTKTPIHKQKHALPYTFSDADYYIIPHLNDAAETIANHVIQGKKIILVYTYNVYEENSTNPEALPDRLVAKLGYDRFKNNILMFNKNYKKTKHAPVILFSEIKNTLDSIKDINNYLIFRYTKQNKKFKEDEAIIMAALKNKFNLIEQEKIKFFDVYTLENKISGAEQSDEKLFNEELTRSIAKGISNRMIYVDENIGARPSGLEALKYGKNKVRTYSTGFIENIDRLFNSGLLVMQYARGRPELTDAEYAIIRQYIANGGRILLLCPAWVWTHYDKKPLDRLPYARIARDFGLQMSSQYVSPPMKTVHPDFKVSNPDEILNGTFSRIEYQRNSFAFPIVEDENGYASVVAATRGNARIIVWGQNNLLSKKNANKKGAQEFVSKALDWLFAESSGDIQAD